MYRQQKLEGTWTLREFERILKPCSWYLLHSHARQSHSEKKYCVLS